MSYIIILPGGLGIGLTTVNPATLETDKLPDNSDLMTVAAGKYWRISRDIDTEEGELAALRKQFTLKNLKSLVLNSKQIHKKLIL